MSMKRKRSAPFLKRNVKKVRTSLRRKRQNKLRSLLSRPQIKYFDTVLGATEASYDSAITQVLNGMAVGDTDIIRDGQQILLNSLQIKGLIRHDINLATGSVVRYLVVLDRYPNEAAAAMNTVLDVAGNADDITSLRARGGSAPDRFRVLVDKMIVLGDPSTGGGEPVVVEMNYYIKLADICQFNDDGAGADTDFQKGKLVFFATSDQAASAAGPTIQFDARVTFYDK